MTDTQGREIKSGCCCRKVKTLTKEPSSVNVRNESVSMRSSCAGGIISSSDLIAASPYILISTD